MAIELSGSDLAATIDRAVALTSRLSRLPHGVGIEDQAVPKLMPRRRSQVR